MTLTSHLKSLPLNKKIVFLRADLNVPLAHGIILNDYRLKALIPTLTYLLNQHATIILATHIGRPHDHEEDLSTRHLIPWFKQHNYPIIFAPHLEQVPHFIQKSPGSIILLENLRFYSGERNHDPQFAHLLARNIDFYVNDAFALLHRTDTSTTLLPHLFVPEKRSIGFLIENELLHLNKLIHNPAHPFTLALGGGKLETKIPLLKNLIPHIDNLLLCPAIVFSFLKALGKPVGRSLIDESALSQCTDLLTHAQHHNVKVLFPSDYQIAQGSFEGPLSFVNAEQFPSDGIGISIGPKTYESFGAVIRDSKTIFYNGLMGSVARPETLQGINALLNAMIQSDGFSVVGGGESVAAAQLWEHADKISYLSTGGGATLNYLSGAPLPGLEPFLS